MLKIEGFKLGDKLECLDIDAYLDLDKEWKNSRLTIIKSSLIVDHIYSSGALSIKDCELCIPVSDFQYFKKKEQSQYTFDDLIDVVTRAYKDKLLSMYSVGGDGAVILKYWIDNNPTRVLRETIIDNVIKHIQSLYKETFVIEDYEDIKRIKKDAQITLANNMKVKVFAAPLRHSEGWKVACADGKQSGVLDIFALKSATVEQERGRDD